MIGETVATDAELEKAFGKKEQVATDAELEAAFGKKKSTSDTTKVVETPQEPSSDPSTNGIMLPKAEESESVPRSISNPLGEVIKDATKPIGSLDADLETKVMDITGNKVTLQSLLDKGWTPEKISANFQIPLVKGDQSILKPVDELQPQIEDLHNQLNSPYVPATEKPEIQAKLTELTKQKDENIKSNEQTVREDALFQQLQQNPDDAVARLHLANTFKQADKNNEAELQYKTITTTHPEYPEGWSGLAGIEAKKGDYTKSDEYYQKALDKNPKRPDILINYATNKAAQDDFKTANLINEDALKIAYQMKDGAKYLPALLNNKAKYLAKLGETEKANKAAEQSQTWQRAAMADKDMAKTIGEMAWTAEKGLAGLAISPITMAVGMLESGAEALSPQSILTTGAETYGLSKEKAESGAEAGLKATGDMALQIVKGTAEIGMGAGALLPSSYPFAYIIEGTKILPEETTQMIFAPAQTLLMKEYEKQGKVPPRGISNLYAFGDILWQGALMHSTTPALKAVGKKIANKMPLSKAEAKMMADAIPQILKPENLEKQAKVMNSIPSDISDTKKAELTEVVSEAVELQQKQKDATLPAIKQSFDEKINVLNDEAAKILELPIKNKTGKEPIPSEPDQKPSGEKVEDGGILEKPKEEVKNENPKVEPSPQAENKPKIGQEPSGQKQSTESLPEFIDLIKAYIKAGYATAKEIISEFRKDYPDASVTDEAIEKVFNDITGKEKAGEGGKEKKVVGRAHKGEFTHEEVKKILERIGLNRSVKSIDEAIKLADRIIDELGIDEAVAAVRRGDVTKGGIDESEAAIVMGRAIDRAHQEFKEATTDREKDIAAQKEADLLNELDQMNVSKGRFIGAMAKVYQLSPLGYKKYARKKIENANEEALMKVQKQLDEAKRQVEASQKEAADLMETNIELKMKLDALQGKKSKTTLSPEKAQRKAELKAEVLGRYNDITTFITILGDKEAMEYTKLAFEEAKGNFKIFAKDILNTLGKKLKEHLPELWRKLGGKESDIEYEPQTGLINRLKEKMKEQNKNLQEQAIKNLSKANKGLWGKYKDGAAEKLANKIASGVLGVEAKKKPILQEFTDGLVKNILGMLPKEQRESAAKKPAIEIIADSFKNPEKYREALEKARQDLQERFNPNEKGIKEEEKLKRQEQLIQLDETLGELYDQPFSEKIVEQSTQEGLKEMFGDDVNKKLIELAKEYFTEGEKVKGTLVDYLVEKTGLDAEMVEPYAKALEEVYDKILNKRVLNIIEKTFPLSPLTKRKGLKEYERIVQAINVGLKTGKRKDGTPFNFEKEFYTKFGLVDASEASVSKKLDEFAEKIYENRNEENPLYQNMATIQLLDWIANRQQENRIISGITEQLYANMLYGEDTHIRNTVFNSQVVLSAMVSQIMQNPKYAGTIMKAFAKNWEQGVTEMKNVIMTGMPKSGSEVKARAFHERAKDINGFLNVWTKYVNKPSRMLQAFDALQNFPMRKSRVAFLLVEEMKKANPSMPVKQIMEQVNQVLYGTDTQQAEWRLKAEEQTQKYYGLSDPLFVDGKRNPVYTASKYNEVYRNNKRSFYNLQDNNLKNESIFEEAKDYADTKFLMNRPKGYFGVGAHLLNELGRGVPMLKVLTTPFVNVPFNIAAHMFEFSPLGYLTVAAGKEGKGISPEYAKKYTIDTEFEGRREKDLLWKATAGTIGMAAAYALTQLKYYDDDEGKERPVLIVMANGTGNYIQNKKLEKLSGSQKFEEYTIDFMGARISYKYSPLAAIFLPTGFMNDAERYGDKGFGDTPNNVELLAKASAGYLLFMKDQSSVSGLADLMNLGERGGFKKEKTFDKISNTTKEFGAKTLRTLITPNFIPQTYRHYKGLFGENETMADGFAETLAKDIPFADQFVDKRYDHFGRLINAKWNIPGIYNEPQKDDRIYQLMSDKKYIDKLRYFRQSSIEADNKQYPLTQEQTDSIDKLRAKYAGEHIERVFNKLRNPKLSNDKFSDFMNQIFNEAQKRAVNELKIIPDEQYSKAGNKIKELEIDLKLLKELTEPKEDLPEEREIVTEEEKEERVEELKNEIQEIE